MGKIEGKKGQKVDEEKLLEEIYKVLDANTEDEQKLEIPMVEATPDEINIDKIHEEDYKEVKDEKKVIDTINLIDKETWNRHFIPNNGQSMEAKSYVEAFNVLYAEFEGREAQKTE